MITESLVDKDIINSTVDLKDQELLNYEYFNLIHSSKLGPLTKPMEVSLLSIKSSIDAEILIFADSEKVINVFIEKGINNIPVKFEYKQHFTVYASPDESYGAENFHYECIKFKYVEKEK